MLAAWQATIVDESGNIQAAASVEVLLESSGATAALFSDRDGASPISNPVTAGSDGFVRFYAAGGAYRINATLGAFSRTWRHVAIGLLGERDAVSGSQIVYDRSSAEISAGITPAQYQYPDPFDPRRYSTSLSTAFLTDRNTAWGYQAFQNATPGSLNTAIGYRAQRNALTGGGGLENAQGNTAVGANCMADGVLTGDYNTAVGYLSMLNATSAYCNAALGIRTLQNLTTGQYNTMVGCDAGLAITTADQNTGLGAKCLITTTTGELNTAAGSSALYFNTTGSHNVAIGALAGEKQTIGGQNTYVGYRCGQENIINSFCTGIGYFTLRLNTAASNTACGHQAMAANTTGTRNAAFGNEALENNDDGNDNTAIGLGALELMLSGDNCTAVGKDSLNNNTADNNTALGFFSGRANTSGTRGTFLGRNAGLANTSGSDNVAAGDNALAANTNNSGSVAVGSEALLNSNAPGNTALGYQAGKDETTGLTNTFLGYQAGVGQTAGLQNSTSLGNGAVCTGSNQITLGDDSIATLRCQVTSITALSDARDKYDVEDIGLGRDFINALRIRRFKWNDRRESGRHTDVFEAGVIAQELLETQNAFDAGWLGLVDASNEDRLEATPGKLLFPLVRAQQETDAIVQSLIARIETLEKAA